MNEAVFLIGFTAEEVGAVKGALRDLEVHEVPRECRDWKLGEIVGKKPEGSGNWHERKFLIIHGSNETIKRVLSAVKPLGLGRIIFVSTTPISLGRTLDELIRGWIEEDEYFRAYRWARREVAQKKGPFLDIGKG